MANWFVSKGVDGRNNGKNWDDAWHELNQIKWSDVSAGDTIWLDGGDSKKVYITPLSVGKSGSSRTNRIKIKRSGEAGRNGYVVIFGGRKNHLPHANIASNRWRGDGTGQKVPAIHLRGFSNIEIDGGITRGITIHGWNNAGIDGHGSNGGGHRFANLEVYSNGTIETVSGKYKTDKAGIRLTGNNVLIERCIVHNNGQDAIQNVGGQRPDNAIIRHCFLANTIGHVDIPHFTWNYNRHPDGVQLYTGGENVTIEDCLIMGMWHGLILGDSKGDFNNGRVRRITFIDNATAIRWHGRADNRNNRVDDVVIKKWFWYPNDNGVGYPNGGNYYLKGSNNKHNRFLICGGGAFTIIGGGHQWSNMYSDGTLDNPVPNSKKVTPKFANPGPTGNRGEHIDRDWQSRDLTIGSSAVDITMTYSGPLDYMRQQTGENYDSYPASIHATIHSSGANIRPIDVVPVDEHPIAGDGQQDGGEIDLPDENPPILLNPGAQSNRVGAFTQLQLHVSNLHKDGFRFSADRLPAGMQIDEGTGIINGTPEQGEAVSITATVTNENGTSSSQSFGWTITAEAVERPTRPVEPEVPVQQFVLREPVDLHIASTDAVAVTATATNLPPGLAVQIIPELSGGIGGGLGGPVGTVGGSPVTLNAESAGKMGDGGRQIGGRVVQLFDLGKVDGEPFKISHTVAPHPTKNPGAPTINGSSWGYTQIKCGGGNGVRYNLITIDLSRPVNQLDYRVGGISAPKENIQSISHGGTVSSLKSGDSGLVSWRNLNGVSQLSFTYKSNSAGNNSFYAPKNKVVLNDPAGIAPLPALDKGETLVDATQAGLIGSSGAGTTQIYNLGNIGGSNLTLTQTVKGEGSSNLGKPFVVGKTGGYSEFSAGGGAGLRTYRVRVASNRPFKQLVWGARGIRNDPDVEAIVFVSAGGSASGLGSGETGLVSWSNLPPDTKAVYFDVVSNSSGNNAGFGPIGDMTLHGGQTAAESRKVCLVGTPVMAGDYDCEVSIDDSTGSPATVPVRIKIR